MVSKDVLTHADQVERVRLVNALDHFDDAATALAARERLKNGELPFHLNEVTAAGRQALIATADTIAALNLSYGLIHAAVSGLPRNNFDTVYSRQAYKLWHPLFIVVGETSLAAMARALDRLEGRMREENSEFVGAVLGMWLAAKDALDELKARKDLRQRYSIDELRKLVDEIAGQRESIRSNIQLRAVIYLVSEDDHITPLLLDDDEPPFDGNPSEEEEAEQALPEHESE